MVSQLAKEGPPYPKIIKYILLFSSSTFKNFFYTFNSLTHLRFIVVYYIG